MSIMTRYSNTGLTMLNKAIEYEHIGTRMFTIFVMETPTKIIVNNNNRVERVEEGKELISLYWELAPIRGYPCTLTKEDIEECLRYYIDIEDLEGTKHEKKAKAIEKKLFKIFGWTLWDALNIPY